MWESIGVGALSSAPLGKEHLGGTASLDNIAGGVCLLDCPAIWKNSQPPPPHPEQTDREFYMLLD